MIVLRSIRMQKGMSIAELAKLSGVSRQTIYKIESGEGEVSTKSLKALADTLGVKITDFFVE